MSVELRKIDPWKWGGIAVFALLPWGWTWGMILFFPDPVSQPEQKEERFRQRASVDTVVVGDSRVKLISERSFSKKGWAFFNMGMSGVSPEDTAMQLKYAMLHGKIRRVVMGVSFEGMTENYPFEFSHYWNTTPFSPPEILDFASVDKWNGPPGRDFSLHSLRLMLKGAVLPLHRAQPKLEELCARWKGIAASEFSPDGSNPAGHIEAMISKGGYDFAHHRDPQIYFSPDFGDSRYLQKRCLSQHAKSLHEKMFRALRDAKIACIVFETGRTTAYQQLIDRYPLLSGLQKEWRSFFTSQSYGSVRFLDTTALHGCYDDEDAFDACHYAFETAARLSRRLADELDDLQQSVQSAASNQSPRSNHKPKRGSS